MAIGQERINGQASGARTSVSDAGRGTPVSQFRVFIRGIVSTAIVGAIILSFSALQSPSAAADGVSSATPTLTTTVIAPMNTTVGNSWNDAATVTGNAASGAPTGSVAFTFCRETAPSTPCSGGTPVGTVSALTTVGDVSTFTLPTSDAQTPTSLGTYCYNAAYTATPGGNYSSVWQQSDSECFTVCPAQARHADAYHDGDRPDEHDCRQLMERRGDGHGQRCQGGTHRICRLHLVRGDSTVDPVSGGTPVGTVSAPTTVGDVSTFTLPTSDAQTPTSPGTYCYNAAYTATPGGNYSSVWQQSDSECFTVCQPQASATPTLTIAVIAPMNTIVGTLRTTRRGHGQRCRGRTHRIYRLHLLQGDSTVDPVQRGDPGRNRQRADDRRRRLDLHPAHQ